MDFWWIMQLNLQRTQLDRTRTIGERVQEENEALSARVHSLELTCAGLWMLLKTKVDCTDEELAAAIHSVDVHAGQMIRTDHEPATCPSCGRKALSQSSTKCLWCGGSMA